MEYKKLRDRELYQKYITLLKVKNKESTIENIVSEIINGQASCFFISLDTAIKYISARKKGLYYKSLKGLRKQKCDDLYNLYLTKRNQSPNKEEIDVIIDVVYSPAPSYYISLDYALQIIACYNDD